MFFRDFLNSWMNKGIVVGEQSHATQCHATSTYILFPREVM